MREAWIIKDFTIQGEGSSSIVYEEPDDYYFNDPDYEVKHICYAELE